MSVVFTISLHQDLSLSADIVSLALSAILSMSGTSLNRWSLQPFSN